MNAWPEVDKEASCPICGSVRRCKVAPDQNAVRCFKSAAHCGGWRLTKNHADGGATYHRNIDRSRTRCREPKAAENESEGSPPSKKQTDVVLLDRAYKLLLTSEENNLLASDRLSLHKRGLSDEEIGRRGYRRSYSCSDQIAVELHRQLDSDFGMIPGFGFDKNGKPTIYASVGLLVPCRDLDGRIVALKLRRDFHKTGPKYAYLSSARQGGFGLEAAVHVPLGISAPAPIVRLTEGELKADVAYCVSHMPTISIPGVSMWRRAIPVLRQLQVETVRVAFDADATINPDVARHMLECIHSLKAERFVVELEHWQLSDGKGIDDLLVSGKTPQILAGDEAVATAARIASIVGVDSLRTPPVVIERLKEKLSQGPELLYADRSLLEGIALLAVQDRASFACVRQAIRQAKLSVKDFDHAIKDLIKAAAAAQPAEMARGDDGGFFVEDGKICRTKFSISGPVTVALCNFVAAIVAETAKDDGVESHTLLTIEGQLDDGRSLPRIEVPAEKYGGMEWVIPRWGSDAIVWPGEAKALGAAIQALSQTKRDGQAQPKVRRTVFCHTGWRKIREQWAYLHGGGAIGGPKFNEAVTVELPASLQGFVLPTAPSGGSLTSAVRASLDILELAPRRITVPLLAAVYRSVIEPADFALHICGGSGLFKSELAALAQQHFGAALDSRHLPGSWSSTANALEGLAFAAMHALLVVDDFAPGGSNADVLRMHRDADRLLRAQGNAAGRQRMRTDGSLRPAKPPRGLILSTGEDSPRGQSLRARLLILEVAPGDVKIEQLSRCQELGRQGLYAQSLSGFIQWLAPQRDSLVPAARGEVVELRNRAMADGQHARTPSLVAELMVGFRMFLAFAADAGAITQAERQKIGGDCWINLLEIADVQAQQQQTHEPTSHFLRLLRAALPSGKCHMASATGRSPEDAAAWGWRKHYSDSGSSAAFDWQPMGSRIGWICEDGVCLEPDASYAAVQRLASEQGEVLAVTPSTLRRRLNDRSLLAATDSTRGTLTIRRTLEGKRRDVLLLHASTLFSEGDPDSHEDDHAP